jgi:DNA-binding MarR family transcriptional regulator
MAVSTDYKEGATTRDVSVHAWLRLVRVFQKVEQFTSRGLRCSDLSLAHFDVLMHVGAAEGITQQEVADSLLVTKGNVCQVLGRMEESGLIIRRQEGRANRLFLTDRGRELFQTVGPAHEERVAQCFTSLSVDDQRELLRLLRTVDRALDTAPSVSSHSVR